MIPPSVLRTIMELRAQVESLEAERVNLQDEINGLQKKVKFNKKELKTPSPIVNVTDVISKINLTIENNLNDIRRAKIKRKILKRKLEEVNKELSIERKFGTINESEIITNERLAQHYYILIKEMFAAPPFPDENLIYKANWRVANAQSHPLDSQFRDIIENLHKYSDPFQELDLETKKFIVKHAVYAQKAMKLLVKEFQELSKQESLGIDVTNVRFEKIQCANDFAYLKLAIDRAFQ